MNLITQRIGKYLFNHEQGVFSLMLVGSVILHILAGIFFGLLSELWIPEPLPIKARIGVRVASLPSKPTLNSNSKTSSSKNFSETLPKLINPVSPKVELIPTSMQALPSIPLLSNTPKPIKSSIPLAKPVFSGNQNPVLTKKPDVSSNPKSPLANKTLTKPKLNPPSLSGISTKSSNLPIAKNKIVPPSPITSKKSKLLPNQPQTPSPVQLGNPVITQKEPAFKKPLLSEPSISDVSKNFKSSLSAMQKGTSPSTLSQPMMPKPVKPSLANIPGLLLPDQNDAARISETVVKPKLNQKLRSAPLAISNSTQPMLEKISPEKTVKQQTLEKSNIVGPVTDQAMKGVPNSKYLMNKKMSQKAEEEYNLHIKIQINPNLGNYSSSLFVRIRLEIMPNGEIINYEIIEKSGSSAFDLAAELAVRNAVLDPLPPILAKKPPYIVHIKIIPQG